MDQDLILKIKKYKIPYKEINQALVSEIPIWIEEYGDDSKVNEMVARNLLYRISQDLFGGVNEIEFVNEQKKPKNHFQLRMYLGDFILWSDPFIYVDDKHKIVSKNTKINILNSDYEDVAILKEEKIKGGKADRMSAEEIAKKFDVSVDKIKSQIQKGVKIEMEHTGDKEKATEIAMDHLTEFPDYYTRLEKMEKEADKHAKKLQVNEDTKTLIKRLIRENLGSGELTADYFKRRIPFLKDFNFFKNERDNTRVEAQRVVYHKNVKKVFKDETFVFPQFNVSSEFTYYQQKINERVIHNFILKNQFHPMQPANMDDLTFKVFIMALKQTEKNLSFSYEGEEVNIDEIINKINEKMFQIEQVSDENNTALF